MTKEEAIAILNRKVSACLHGTEWGEALDMAIKALEQEPCEDATLKDIFCMGCEYKEQEPCKASVEGESELPIVETPLAFDVGGHTYGVIGGDEAMKRFREGAKE